MRGQMTCQDSLQSLAEVFHQMKSICTLDGLRCATGCRRGIVAAAIPAHQRDFWVCCHPSSSGFCLSIRQHINHFMALHVDQDGAKFSPTTEREIIDAKL
jgi:hypothetical protein